MPGKHKLEIRVCVKCNLPWEARRTSSAKYCSISCAKKYTPEQRSATAEKRKLWHKEYRSKNKHKINARQSQLRRAKYAANLERSRELGRIRYRESSPDVKLQYRKRAKRYKSTALGKATHRAKEANRRAVKLNATPAWANLDMIKKFYKNCPTGYHVDHIVPLRGKEVSGLHVENNLQYLPASENCRKGNKLLAAVQA